jgi:hypothetical protein
MKIEKNENLKVMLVYQAGLANIFKVKYFNLSPSLREAERILQDDFRTCESVAFGMGLAGAIVRTAACNAAGDIKELRWSDDLNMQPFSNKFRPVTMN